jgi:hypothetical protein
MGRSVHRRFAANSDFGGGEQHARVWTVYPSERSLRSGNCIFHVPLIAALYRMQVIEGFADGPYTPHSQHQKLLAAPHEAESLVAASTV